MQFDGNRMFGASLSLSRYTGLSVSGAIDRFASITSARRKKSTHTPCSEKKDCTLSFCKFEPSIEFTRKHFTARVSRAKCATLHSFSLIELSFILSASAAAVKVLLIEK